jgi:hypothetical protein
MADPAASEEASQSVNTTRPVASKAVSTPIVNVGRFSVKTKNVTPKPPKTASNITEELNNAAEAESPPPSEAVASAVPAAVGAVVTTGRFTIVTPPVSNAPVTLDGATQVKVAPPGLVSPERRPSMPSILEGSGLVSQHDDETNVVRQYLLRCLMWLLRYDGLVFV